MNCRMWTSNSPMSFTDCIIIALFLEFFAWSFLLGSKQVSFKSFTFNVKKSRDNKKQFLFFKLAKRRRSIHSKWVEHIYLTHFTKRAGQTFSSKANLFNKFLHRRRSVTKVQWRLKKKLNLETANAKNEWDVSFVL